MAFVNNMRLNNLQRQLNDIEDSVNNLILGVTGPGLITRDIDLNGFSLTEVNNVSYNNGEVLHGNTGNLYYGDDTIITNNNIQGVTGLVFNPLTTALDCSDNLTNVSKITMVDAITGNTYNLVLYNGVPTVLNSNNSSDVLHCISTNENSAIEGYCRFQSNKLYSVGSIEIEGGQLLFGNSGKTYLNWNEILTTANIADNAIVPTSTQNLDMNNFNILNANGIQTTTLTINNQEIGFTGNNIYIGNQSNTIMTNPSDEDINLGNHQLVNVSRLVMNDTGNEGTQFNVFTNRGELKINYENQVDYIFLKAETGGGNINCFENSLLDAQDVQFYQGYALGHTGGNYDAGYLHYNGNRVLVEGPTAGVYSLNGNSLEQCGTIEFTNGQTLQTDSGNLLFDSGVIYTSNNPPPADGFVDTATANLNMNFLEINNVSVLDFGTVNQEIKIVNNNLAINNSEIVTAANIANNVNIYVPGATNLVTQPTNSTNYVFNSLPENTTGYVQGTVQMLINTPVQGQEAGYNGYFITTFSFGFSWNSTTNKTMIIPNSYSAQDIVGGDSAYNTFWAISFDSDVTVQPTIQWNISDNGSIYQNSPAPVKISYIYHKYD